MHIHIHSLSLSDKASDFPFTAALLFIEHGSPSLSLSREKDIYASCARRARVAKGNALGLSLIECRARAREQILTDYRASAALGEEKGIGSYKCSVRVV